MIRQLVNANGRPAQGRVHERRPRGHAHGVRAFVCAFIGMGALAACTKSPPAAPIEDPRVTVLRHVPRSVSDRSGWAADIYAPFQALNIKPNVQNICAVIAVIEQESSFRVNPPVPDMPKIAMRAIDERAGHSGVPLALVHTALGLSSSTGRTYDEWIASARTEKDLSDIFEDFTGKVPLGRTLFQKFNPIHTRGPMQVNVSFADSFSRVRSYPWKVDTSIQEELFTRRGSLYFGIAHLLSYPAGYDRYLYRFADFNAGQYASRNAAFQNAVAVATGLRTLVRDGALVPGDGDADHPGITELALQMLDKRLKLGRDAVARALQTSKGRDFEQTALYRQVFALADKAAGKPLPRAMVPQIELHGPKISRRLTTDWYAHRVDERFQRCQRAPGSG